MAHCGAPPGGTGYCLERCNSFSFYQDKNNCDRLRVGRPGFGSCWPLSSPAAPLCLDRQCSSWRRHKCPFLRGWSS